MVVSALVIGAAPATGANIEIDGISLPVVAHSVRTAQVVGGGERGAALGVLADGTLLLGGGARGGSVYRWSPQDRRLRLLGNLMTADERAVDARFAITDIAVLSESGTTAQLLVSYPRLVNGRCVDLVVHRVTFDRTRDRLTKQERWFRGWPCVPVSAVQHAGGRIAVIDSKSAYLTVGDLGYPHIDDRSRRGKLGSVFRISRSGATKVSSGHRNQQGIVLFDERMLITSEHGPRGGDELNIIRRGNDYGWPFVTYGEPYGAGDYVIPLRTGTHQGYREPITYWVPSIAPTELLQLPSSGWGTFSGGLALGTLRQEALVFIQLVGARVTRQLEVPIGARIRDLERMPDGRLAATTDDGRVLFVG